MLSMKARALAGAMIVAGLASPALAQTRSGGVQPFTQQERQQGAQAHQQILSEMGGAMTGRAADYARMVGQNISVQSGLSSARSDFNVTLLNSAVNNAFALPGGYVYVTRQLMGLMNNEAELAGVLGHEVAHTAARHARQRQNAATRNGLLGVAGTILGGLLGNNGGLLGTLGRGIQQNAMRAAQVATLGFSRSQETQADDLGIQYLARAGYDTRALSTMLASLAAQNALDVRAAGRDARDVPEWASTHPDPASRVQRALQMAQRVGGVGGRTNRDEFLNALNGTMYADDPAQGVVEGRDFLHPDLRFGFTVPQGFGIGNSPSAVNVSGNTGQAQFTTLGRNAGRDLQTYVGQVFQQIAGGNQQGQQSAIQAPPVRRTTINGLPAAYASTQANTQNGPVEVTVVAYDFGDQIYHFQTLARAGGSGVFDSMFNSVRRLSTNEVAAIRPRRIEVMTVPRNGASVQSYAQRMAYRDYQDERFRVLNGLSSNTNMLPGGTRVKVVTYGTR